MQQKQIVRIVPIGELEQPVVDNVAAALHQQYGLETDIEFPLAYSEVDIDLSAAPYSAEQILAAPRQQGPEQIVLLVTRLPITHNGREFIFGLADPASSSCVMSTYRLFQAATDNTYTDPETAIARVRKEALHEVGHVLGRSHCGNQKCVMNFSINVESVDNKSEQLCPECAGETVKERNA